MRTVVSNCRQELAAQDVFGAAEMTDQKNLKASSEKIMIVVHELGSQGSAILSLPMSSVIAGNGSSLSPQL